jgi:hypothetical protein
MAVPSLASLWASPSPLAPPQPRGYWFGGQSICATVLSVFLQTSVLASCPQKVFQGHPQKHSAGPRLHQPPLFAMVYVSANNPHSSASQTLLLN